MSSLFLTTKPVLTLNISANSWCFVPSLFVQVKRLFQLKLTRFEAVWN